MNTLWAPWRMTYIQGKKQKKCVLCTIARNKKNDRRNFVLLRSESAFSVLNLYPYNNGHFMVCPLRHVKRLEDLNTQEVSKLFVLLKQTKNLTDKTLHPHAYNIGINIGRVGGAGIAGHIHIHVVPRWEGDTNFMPITADTKVIPQSLASLHKKLLKTQ